MLAVLDFLKTVYAIRWGMWFYKSTHYYSDMSTNPPGLYFPSLLVQSNEWALKVNAYYVDYDRCIFFQTPVMNMDRYAAAESFYKLAMAFAPVPDLHIMWLLHLCDAHQEMQSWAEAAQCAVAVAGVVMQVACSYIAIELNVLNGMMQTLTVVVFQRNCRCSFLQKMEGFHFPILPLLYALIVG